VLSLYDPDRSQVAMEAGASRRGASFFRDMEKRLYTAGKPNADLRIRILTETVCSPTLADQIRTFMKSFPQTRWHQYEPCGRINVNVGGRNAFGPAINTLYDFSKAERILSLDSNFLYDEAGQPALRPPVRRRPARPATEEAWQALAVSRGRRRS
jgi:molybdopterin-containing oxidoreductase family iron-sulfur binding subunit